MRVRWGHPLARGLQFCAVPLGNTFIDLVTGVVGTPTGTSTSRARGQAGGKSTPGVFPAVAASGAFTDQVIWPASTQRGGSITTTGTILALAGTTEQVDGKAYVIGGNTDGAVTGEGFSLFVDSFLVLGRGNIGSGKSNAVWSAAVSSQLGNPFDNRLHFFGYSFTGGGGIGLGTYLGGRTALAGDTPVFGTTTANRRAIIANSSVSSSAPVGCSHNAMVALMLIYDRAISLAEYQQLYDNPWQITAPAVATRRIWVAPSAGGAFAASLADAATGADSSSAVLASVASVTEAGAAADSSSRTLAASAAAAEAAAATDSPSATKAGTAGITEAGTATDAPSATLASAASTTEAASTAETLAATLAASASITEAASAAESVNASPAGAAAVAEAAAATDVASATLTAAASTTEAAAAADTSNAAGAAYLASVTEAASATDAQTSTRVATAAVSEAATAAEFITGLMAGVATLTESSPAIDASTGGLLLFRGVVESGATAADAVDAAPGAPAIPTERVVRAIYHTRIVRTRPEQRTVRTILIERRVSSMGTVQDVAAMDEGEGGPLTFDFTDEMQPLGVTIPNVGSVTIEVDVRSGSAKTPTTILDGAATLDGTKRIVVQEITPAGKKGGFAVRCRAVGSDGIPRVAVALLPVERL